MANSESVVQDTTIIAAVKRLREAGYMNIAKRLEKNLEAEGNEQ